MMTERNLGAIFFDRDVVENAAPQPGTDGAEGLAFGHEPFDNRIGVALDDAKGHGALPQVFGQNVRGKVWLFLVKIDCQEVEANGGALAHVE
jgi:hypothetical protein